MSVSRLDTGGSSLAAPPVTRSSSPPGRAPWLVTSREGEEGSGSVLAVALMASLLMLAGLALPLNAALTTRQLTANAADAAALAAADTASGLVPGYPCANAAEAARLHGATLGDCTVTGLDVQVTALRQVLGIVVSVAARAGPAPPEKTAAILHIRAPPSPVAGERRRLVEVRRQKSVVNGAGAV